MSFRKGKIKAANKAMSEAVAFKQKRKGKNIFQERIQILTFKPFVLSVLLDLTGVGGYDDKFTTGVFSPQLGDGEKPGVIPVLELHTYLCIHNCSLNPE